MYVVKQFLIDSNYLPERYFDEFDDAITLARFITDNWATPLETGKSGLEFAWRVLCDYHNLDPNVMYDDVMNFWEAQGVGLD